MFGASETDIQLIWVTVDGILEMRRGGIELPLDILCSPSPDL